jgi:alkylation response protein AidB-like acyl-CoA dehydrogenase
MGQTDVLEKETSGNGEMQIEPYEIDYNKLHGRGAAFLITPLGHGSVFSREQFSEEHRMFEQTAKEFGENRILPVREELNVLNKDLSLEIFREMGKLGFLGVDVEEEYGGLSLDKTTACIIPLHQRLKNPVFPFP